MKYTHYAPRAKVIVVEGDTVARIQMLNTLVEQERSRGKIVGILATQETAALLGEADVMQVVGRAEEPLSIAAGLFQALRAFDDTSVDVIYAEGISEKGIGLAIMNRLRKAAGNHIIHAQ
jgi:L-threonylcarbamoyladenylate synthase